jgi:hypothetical protein
MRKYILITLAFLFCSQLNYAQALEGEENGFTIKLALKYKDANAVDITISDSGEGAKLLFRGTDCEARGNLNIPITDEYIYQQLRDYLGNIDIETYQPQKNNHDNSADLQIKFIYFSHGVNRKTNTFHLNYNPNNIGDENMILEYLLEVMDVSVIKSCDRDFYEKVKSYIEGE